MNFLHDFTLGLAQASWNHFLHLAHCIISSRATSSQISQYHWDSSISINELRILGLEPDAFIEDFKFLRTFFIFGFLFGVDFRFSMFSEVVNIIADCDPFLIRLLNCGVGFGKGQMSSKMIVSYKSYQMLVGKNLKIMVNLLLYFY